MKKLLLKIAVIAALFVPAVASAQVPVSAGGTGMTSVPAGECVKGLDNLRLTSGPCGGGGSGGGTSTSTSQVSGRLVVYPTNATDIWAVGSNSTTTAEFYFDPNVNAMMQSAITGTTTFMGTTTMVNAVFNGGPWVDAKTCGAKGDGVTNDVAALNACLTDLGNKGGGKLYISAHGRRSATTKYLVCGTPITVPARVWVEVQQGVEIQNCNGNATSTVQFVSGSGGTFFARWKGGLITEAGTPQKLWTPFNLESHNSSGGVFWNKIEDVVIYFPKHCIRSAIVGAANGWLNSNTYRDIICNYPTSAWPMDDYGTQGLYGISNTFFDNVQVQGNSSVETCFPGVKHNWTIIVNPRCYDMPNATSTSLVIDSTAIGTTVIGGFATERGFEDNGTRTTITGDALYPYYTKSTASTFSVNTAGRVALGTTTSNWYNASLNIANGGINLAQSNSSFGSPIRFYWTSDNEWQQDYIKAATTTGGSPNSGNIIISAREGLNVNLDSDNTSSAGKFAIRSNRSDGGVSTTGEILTVTEPGLLTVSYASTTALSATTFCLNTCITSWPAGGSGAFSWTPSTNYNALTNATGTPIWLQAGLQASTTSHFDYASSTAFTGTLALYAGNVASTLGANSNMVKPGTGNGFLNIKGGQGKAKIGIGNTGMTFMTGDAFSPDYDFRIGATSDTNTGASILKLYGTGGLAFGSSFSATDPGSGRMIIQSSLGIATTSAHQALTINGNAYIAGFVTSTSTTAASTFPYASTTALSVGGRTIAGTFDKSWPVASSTPDASYKRFNTATTSRVVWNPSIPAGLSQISCKVTNGSGTVMAAIGTGSATTTIPCSTTRATAASSVTWSAGADVWIAVGTLSGTVNDVVITGTFYNQ
jgi:hypothetical protein